jgi:hypothetical protein
VKTFKLISLQIVEETHLVDIRLEAGLIINREDDTNSWLIEAFTDQSHYPHFQKDFDTKKDVIVQVVISKKENDPASFQTKVCSVKKIGEHVSILFEGKLKSSKSNYAELLLDHLLHKGLGGNALMVEFTEKMKTRPMIEDIKK